MFKFNIVRKWLTQLKIPSQLFLAIEGNVFEMFFKVLYIAYKFLYTLNMMLKFNSGKKDI